MAKTGTNKGNHQDLLEEAFCEYLRRLDAGEDVDRQAFISRYPDVADVLAEHLDADSIVRRMAGPTYAEATAHGQIDATITGDVPIGEGEIDDVDSGSDFVSAGRTVAGQDTVIASQSNDTHPGGEARQSDIPVQFGRYRVEKLLGQGAMGSVYLAHDTQLDRRVALKIPKFDQATDADMLERFYREARAVATLHHPNICPVYDVGEIDGQTFLSMAYIEGRPLSDYTKSQKKQGERSVAKLVMKLARALQEAHEIGVVHRDLKPANIMVGKKGEPVVMDFGLARRLNSTDTRVTKSGTIVGTPAYMSPEQVEGDPDAVGPGSDQFSLGVILYEMLAGQLPFQGTVLSVIGQIAHKAPRRIEELRPDVDPHLAAICGRMMSKNPTDRFRNMAAAADALHQYLTESKSGVSQWDVVPADQPLPSKPRRRRETTASIAKQQPANRSQRRKRHYPPPWQIWTAVGVLSLVAILAAVVLFLQTPEGTVRIEVTDPDTQVEFAGQTFTFDDNGAKVEVTPGKHALHVKRGSLSFTTQEFTVEKDSDVAIKVTWQDSELSAMRDGKEIGRKADPRGLSGADGDDRGWTSLFNGRDLTGWLEYKDGTPATKWVVDNGTLHLASQGGGNIMTAGTYSDFELEFEWKISEGGNSGVIYRVRTGDPAPFHSGLEYQIVDDDQHPNGKNPKTSAASLYSLLAPLNKSLKPVGQWNTGRIVVRGNHVEHWLNGKKVVDADIGSDQWNLARSQSGFIKWPEYGTVQNGHIVLQDFHGSVWYRNIRIRRLPESISPPMVGDTQGEHARDRLNVGKNTLATKLTGLDGGVEDVAYADDGKSVVAVAGKEVRRWSSEDGKPLQVYHLDKAGAGINSLLPLRDGRRLVTGTAPGGQGLQLWDLQTLKVLREFPGHDTGSHILARALSPDERLLLSSGGDSTVRLWNLETGKQLHQVDGNYASAAAFNADGTQWAGANWNVVTILDVQTAEVVRRISPVGRGAILDMAFSPDGRLLLTAGNNPGGLSLHEVATGRKLLDIGLPEEVRSCAFLPDGRHFVAGCRDKTIRVWQTQSGEEVLRVATESYATNYVAVAPDGRSLASGGGKYWAEAGKGAFDGDANIYLWRLPKSVWPQQKSNDTGVDTVGQ